MDISIVGLGYVGLCTGAGFGLTQNVIGIDIDKDRVDKINKHIPPIYEQGLEEKLKCITATTDYNEIKNTDITFICVGTPNTKEGGIDLKYIIDAAVKVGEQLKTKDTYHVVVVKSTVIPGTTENIVIPALERSSGKKAGKDFGVCMNPEFLREGTALNDFLHPDLIVIGQLDCKSGDILAQAYEYFYCKPTRTDLKTAEMVKYTLNAALATKISFINEIGNICKRLDINTYEIAGMLGEDRRISKKFLRPGLGWGGSCFPKDVDALITLAEQMDYTPNLLKSAVLVNEVQPERFFNMAREKVGRFNNKRVAVMGLAFKPGTDDIRQSPATPIINRLIHEHADVIAYDPKAEDNMRSIFGQTIDYADKPEDALKDADVVLILTDWPEFKELNYDLMKNKIVIDGRNIVKNREGIDYTGLCW